MMMNDFIFIFHKAANIIFLCLTLRFPSTFLFSLYITLTYCITLINTEIWCEGEIAECPL